MTRTKKMPALPPPPVFQPSANTNSDIKKRFLEIKRGPPLDQNAYDNIKGKFIRTVTGNHGWTATIFGPTPDYPSVHPAAGHALQDILIPLADWWIAAVTEAVTNCPEPENARRQSLTKDGRKRLVRITRQSFRVNGDFVIPSEDWETFCVDAEIRFDGNAPAHDIIWPFPLDRVTQIVVDAIKEAIETPYQTGPAGPETAIPEWQPFFTTRRGFPRKQRIFEDFSGRTPEQRGVHITPPSALLLSQAGGKP